MGTRVIRFRGQQLIAEQLRPVIGRPIEVILRNNATLTGELTDVDPREMVLCDSNRQWYNTRQHTHRIPLSDVVEVLVTRQEAY